MNKLFLLAAPVLAVAMASPAAAQTSGFRLEGVVAYDETRIDIDGTGPLAREKIVAVAYGVGVGYDFPVGPNLSIGADAEVTESTGDEATSTGSFTIGSDVYLGGRVTAGVTNSLNIYGRLGYSMSSARNRPTNTAIPITRTDLDGMRGALGFQIVDDNGAFYGVEVRYTDYDGGANRRQAAAVIGMRF